MEIMTSCVLCPRACGVNRAAGQRGRCHVTATLKLARAALHMWEEPCISGSRGSGAVFFSGCSLGCVYCQNREISRGESGIEITQERLAEIFLELQDEGAANINLVTAGHYVPQVCNALRAARAQGLSVPVVYNSSGYEKAETLRLLEGLVDIYLPDFKYMDPELAARYSYAADYPETAKAAIREMVRQQPQPHFNKEGMMTAGVIVRHLLLPGHVREAKRVVQYLHETYGNQIYISMMNQYTPVGEYADDSVQQMREGTDTFAQQMPENTDDFGRRMREGTDTFAQQISENADASGQQISKNTNPCGRTARDPLLCRRVTKREYARLLSFAEEIGVEQGFYQEGGTAEESFIPPFNCEGVLPAGKEQHLS